MPDAAEDAPPTAVVFAGGDPPARAVLDRLPAGAYVIAADSGLVHAQQAGFDVDVVVGDLDSVPADSLDDARIAGTAIERHPVDKDATDLELAFDRARDVGVERVVLLCADGGRVDHFLANVALLGHERYSTLTMIAYLDETRVEVVRPGRDAHVQGRSGDLVTLLALGGPATGVTTTGLHWALRDADLIPGSTLGVSNVFETAVATIAVAAGALLVVQPNGTR